MKKIALGILAFILLVLFFIPNIAEIYIEQKDKELIGRELHIGDIDLNYFTGNIGLEEVYMLEQNEVDTFAGFELLEVNLGIWSVIRGEYEVESILLDRPMVNVLAIDSLFNFSDLISEEETTVMEEPVKEVDRTTEEVNYSVGNIQVRNLLAKYGERDKFELGIDSLNLNVESFAWNKQIFKGDVSMMLSEGGDLTTSFEVDIASGDYQTTIDLNQIWLDQFTPIIKDFIKINHLTGLYSNHLKVAGNYNEDTNVQLSGDISLEDLRLIDQYSIEQASLGNLSIGIDSIDLSTEQYHFDHIAVDKPYMAYALYSGTDSFSELLYEEEADSVNVTEQDSVMVEDEVSDSTFMSYAIGDFAISNGAVEFSDYSLIHDFHYLINELSVDIDSIDNVKAWTVVNIGALLNYSGDAKIRVDIDVNDSKNFAYQADIDSIPLVDFSPYSHQFVAHPVNRGMMYFDGSAETSKHFLRSDNVLMLDQVKLGDKRKHSESMNLPVKAAVALLKNPKGEIKIKLPVRGNLDDPEFKIWRTVLNTLKNLVIKTVSAPITVVGKVVSISDKEVNEIPYQLLQTSFDEETAKVIGNIGKRVKDHKGHKATITQQVNPVREKNAIALLEAKRQYLYNSTDSASVWRAGGLQPIDSGFQAFVNEQIVSDTIMNLYDKCLLIIGEEKVEQRYSEIVEQRNAQFRRLVGNGENIEVVTGTPTDSKSLRTIFLVNEY